MERVTEQILPGGIDRDLRRYTLAEYLELLQAAGVDEATHAAVAAALREHFAELERKAAFSAHVRSQMAARASRDGESGGRLPLGYMRTDTRVAIDEGGAAAVRFIFRMKRGGLSLRGIASQLNAEHVSTSYGGKKWTASSVREIISREAIYRGAQRKDSPQCWPTILPADLALQNPLPREPEQRVPPDGAEDGTSPSSLQPPQLTLLAAVQQAAVKNSQGTQAAPDAQGLQDSRPVNANQLDSGPTVLVLPHPAQAPKTFVPSVYQQAIFDFLASGTGDGLINAVAGSGKTSTLEQAAKRLPPGKQAIFVAFNKKIADELASRLRGTTMVAQTIHSIGYRCVLDALKAMIRNFKRLEPDKHARKYHQICREIFYATMPYTMPVDAARSSLTALEEIVKFARLTLIDGQDTPGLADLVDHFGIELDPEYQDTVLDMVWSDLDFVDR